MSSAYFLTSSAARSRAFRRLLGGLSATALLCVATGAHGGDPQNPAAATATATADDADNAQRAELQRQLNQQVMAAPFNPGDIQKAEAYAEQARKSNLVPVMQVPSYWSPGWTCGNMTSYRYYNYGDYRNCVYYHHHYGRYWR
jgi:hypothetical protein